MTTICFLNRKGGSAKTSTTFHLAGALAQAGHRILLADHDPQASLTQGFFGSPVTEAMDPAATVAALYMTPGLVLPEAVVLPTGLAGVDILPGSLELDEYNYPERFGWEDLQWSLRLFLDLVRDRYDFCLIDCPPNVQLCARAAMVAADAVVVPLQAEDFGSQGLAHVHRAVERVRSGLNPGLSMAGFLLSMFDRRLAVHTTYEEKLRARFGPMVFSAVVPRAKDFVEAVAFRKPVSVVKPKSAAAFAVRAVAEELAGRLAAGAGQGRGAA